MTAPPRKTLQGKANKKGTTGRARKAGSRTAAEAGADVPRAVPAPCVSPAARGKGAEPQIRKRELQVYPGWCKRCGICIAFCPGKALEADPEGVPRWASPESCTGCRLCELRCPDFAIEILEEEEMDHASGA